MEFGSVFEACVATIMNWKFKLKFDFYKRVCFNRHKIKYHSTGMCHITVVTHHKYQMGAGLLVHCTRPPAQPKVQF